MHRHGLVTSIATALAALTVASLVADTAQAEPAAGLSHWRVVYEVRKPNETFVPQVSAVSPRDAWAVGEPDVNAAGYVLRWNGSRWRKTSSPFTNFRPSGVTALSATNVWLFSGDFAAAQWNGSVWNEIVYPEYAGALGGVDGNQLWVYGRERGSRRGWTTEVWRYVGGTWTIYHLPLAITGFDVYSSHDIWAVGPNNAKARTGYGRLAAWRWGGSSWSRVRLPRLEGPASVGIASPHSVWLTTVRPGGTPYNTFLVHWINGRWISHGVPYAAGYEAPPPAPVPYRGGAWLYANYLWTGTHWARPRIVLPASCRFGFIASIATVPGSRGAWGAMACQRRVNSQQIGAIAEYGSAG